MPREIAVTLGKGVAGTIAVPDAVDDPGFHAKGLAPPTHKCAIIFHGQGGHRDYCYQKELAHRLASALGVYSLRIDFRGCGSSAENADFDQGRRLSQDVEDIADSVDFMADGSKNPLGISFTVSSLIAHSRGSVSQFLWAIQEDKKAKAGDPTAVVVPNLINCASRFSSHTVFEKFPVLDEDFPDRVGQIMLRHGKYQPVDVMKPELVDQATVDLSGVANLSSETSVLSIYGLHDQMVPVTDSAIYANMLNRGPLTHHLELIAHADHNYFGTEPIEDEEQMEELNPAGLPLNGSNLVNYNPLVVDKIIDFLKPENEAQRFYAQTKYVGHATRFKQVDGVVNFRDIGGWRILNPRFPVSKPPLEPYYVQTGLVYRSANFADVTETGLKALQTLGVKVIFDLRSEGECRRDGVPKNLDQYGITRHATPLYGSADYSPQALATRYSNLMTSWSTYVSVYEEMLDKGSDTFKQIFRHILNYPRTPFVIQCTAGKDRTGIVAMLILLLTGLDHHTIAKEYELTQLGLQPAHAKIKEKFLHTMEKMRAKVGPGLEKSLAQGREGWTLEKDGFDNLVSSRYEAMLATIDLFNNKYGGILTYMENNLGFLTDDVLKIYDHLVTRDNINFAVQQGQNEWSHRVHPKPNL